MLSRITMSLRYRWQHREPTGSAAARKVRLNDLKTHKADAADLIRKIGIPAASLTGADGTDYLALHRYITSRRPNRVLELGGGVTTLVMAHAMHEIGYGELVSVEHIRKYADETKRLVVAPFDQRVRFCHTSIMGDTFNGDPVLRFDELPTGHYDMIFCDFTDAIGGYKGVYFPHVDPLLLLDDQPTDIITDRKLFTLRYYAKHLRCQVSYDPALSLGVILAATRANLGGGRQQIQLIDLMAVI